MCVGAQLETSSECYTVERGFHHRSPHFMDESWSREFFEWIEVITLL